MRATTISSCVLSVSLLAVACGGGRETPSPGTLRIAVVPKGSTHEHWKRVHAGADKAAAEYRQAGVPVDVLWKAPIREDDREQQVQVVEGFISQRVNGLVLAPLDSHALLRPVEEAAQAGVPTVIFDSALADPAKAVSYVSTDNGKGGRLAAQRMGEVLQRYRHGADAAIPGGLGRHRGARARLPRRTEGHYPGVTVISSDQYAGATRDTAKRTSENLLNRYARQGERDLHAERVIHRRHAPRPAGHPQGGRDQLRGLRLQRRLSSSPSAKAS